jgi:hypothetical protein
LALKRNATASYQDLVDHHAYQGAHNSVKRFVQKITFRELERFDRLVLAPGEEAKVDYWREVRCHGYLGAIFTADMDYLP